MADWEFKRHYALLKAKVIPVCYTDIRSNLSEEEMEWILKETGPLAVDFETSGLRWADKGFQVRSVALVNDKINLAIDFNTLDKDKADRLWGFLANHKGLIAHNATFEAGVIWSQTKVIPDVHICTRAMAYALAGEGSPGQSWGLKSLAKDLLGAEDWNEEIDINNMMSEDWTKVGKYNQLDTHYTWYLYRLMAAVIHENSDTWGRYFMDYHQLDVMNMIKLQVETYVNGLHIDTDHLDRYSNQVQEEIKGRELGFFSHPKVAEGVEVFQETVIQKYWTKLHATKKEKKDGTVSQAYLKAQVDYQLAKTTRHFNINSNAHLIWLIYDYLGMTSKTKTDGGGRSVSADALSSIPEIGKLILEYREPLAMSKFLAALTNNLQGGKVRIPIRAPGTVTGRCSAGEI